MTAPARAARSDLSVIGHPAGRRLGLREAVAAEWLKLLTVRSTWWFALGLLALLLTMAVLDDGEGEPGSVRSLTVGLAAVSYFGQYVVAAFGLLVVTAEYATRSITVTLAATPSRARVLVAKAIVACVAAGVLGVVATALGVGVAAGRFGELDHIAGPATEQILATGGYPGLLAALSLGVGALVRRTAGALTVMVVLLLVVPELLALASRRFGLRWLDTLAGWTPAQAGWQLMTGHWEYAALLLAWAVAAVAAGAWVLRRRDA
jgi:ABC-2 type transport system permease protein